MRVVGEDKIRGDMHITKRSFFSVVFLSSFLGGLIVYLLIESFGSYKKVKMPYLSISQKQNIGLLSNQIPVANPDFREAAQQVLPGVVSIHTYYSNRSNPIDALFDQRAQSTGSGVIISEDGYIATNHHVIENAEKIEVILSDNRSYFATLIGQDKTTDLALLRIEEKRLPYVKYGNSDKVIPGEWVLAIGNPFELNSTVTAGIVSAKARNMGIINDNYNLGIESFIQTDAAVNPGNSGGALVNLKGELVGINTAIATQSGVFEGYSFAIPVSLVKKVMDDILEFGEVKRGLLGIIIQDVNARIAEANDLPIVNGVIIGSVNDNSAGREAGLKEGDVIIGVNNMIVTNTSELQELVARNRPGDLIHLTFIRNNKEFTIQVKLRDYEGKTSVSSKRHVDMLGGARFLNPKTEMEGIEITEISEGPFKDFGFSVGDKITHIDKARVLSVGELLNVMKNKKGGILFEGTDLQGKKFIRAIEW